MIFDKRKKFDFTGFDYTSSNPNNDPTLEDWARELLDQLKQTPLKEQEHEHKNI